MAALDPTLANLNDCACCAGLGAETPAPVQNRPGLSAIAYRSGTWREFKASLLARLSAQEYAPLARLTTRADDDFTIALLDAFATLADVLTFYQERIANEGYLRTATERRSILELARLIGYELGPGVAAETLLAFTVDDAPGAPRKATIDVGVKVQSVPGQDEKPQTFETVEKIDARAEWNAMTPRPVVRQVLPAGATQMYLAGVATNLRAGDALLIVSADYDATDGTPGHWDLLRLTAVEPDAQRQWTRVSWDHGLAQAYDFSTWDQAPRVYALRTRASLFGYNAPDPKLLPSDVLTNFASQLGSDKSFWTFAPPGSQRINLDTAYPAIRGGSWVVLVTPRAQIVLSATSGGVLARAAAIGIGVDAFVLPPEAALYQVTRAIESAREEYALSGKATQLELVGPIDLGSFHGTALRATMVFGQSDPLGLAEQPAPAVLAAGQKEIVLAADVGDLPVGRRLLIAGIEDSSGRPATEEATVDAAAALTLTHLHPTATVTQLTLVAGLKHSYRRDTVSIYGNVAAATHGEAVAEVLGAGDASKSYQGFTLRQPPLTFVRNESSPTGAASTLVLRVNDLRWDEVPFFYGRGPAERVFTTRIDDDGKTAVQFGDGVHGARLPTGQENVRATYRKGVGAAGNVNAGKLTTLLTRPLGLKAAQNPAPAVGGDDPESRDDARENAPLKVRTLERVVSLLDYEDFARAYAGIAKALATWSWDGQRRGVFLTVAAPGGDPVAAEVLEKLAAAMRKAGDPFVALRLKSYRAAAFRTTFKVKVDAAYDKPLVLARVVQQLRDHFAFAVRAFGQPVALAEVMATLQSVSGVVAVDVDELVRSDGVGGSGLDQPLPAAVPELTSLGDAEAAELLTLSSDPVEPRRHGMSFGAQRLFELLPVIHRLRDGQAQHPGALRALIDVIAEQIAVLEEDLAQAYDDQFIETCAEWIAPYIGDLIGYRSLHAVAPRIGSPRAEVANTIAYRRRKGTASMLEQLARDVSGWDARAVEYFQPLATTQYLNHLRRRSIVSFDVRHAAGRPAVSTPFDAAAHGFEARRIARGRGRYNIPNVGIWLWRIGDYPLEATPAVKVVPADPGDRRYFFSPLGADAPLFNAAEAEDTITHIATRANVPQPITRRELHDGREAYYPASVAVSCGGVRLPVSAVAASDLSDLASGAWAYADSDVALIDPELGRLVLPASLTLDGHPVPMTDPVVSFHYGFPADLGGGQYGRDTSFLRDASAPGGLTPVVQVSDAAGIAAALTAPVGTRAVEVTGNGRHMLALTITPADGARIELRAADGVRPTLVLGQDLVIDGGKDAEVTLNGFLLIGAAVAVAASSGLRRLRLIHCTLVPGLTLATDGTPQSPDAPSLVVNAPGVALEIERSIVGGLRVHQDAVVGITDSIVDATDPTRAAFAAPDGTSAGGELSIMAGTVIGKVHTRILRLVSNTILAARLAAADPWPFPVHAERRQEGCVRFSYVPPGSRTPRRHACQPASAADAARMQPLFTSSRYGRPAYCQLALRGAVELRTGSDDESEMGAYHHLYAPQRATNVTVRLEEYLRFGLEAGILYAS